MTFPTRIVMPATAKKGQAIEVKTIVQHPMETGYRRDARGGPIPRHIITRMVATYDGVEVFSVDLSQGVAANPFIAFTTVAMTSGEIVLTWHDEQGPTYRAAARITVV